jgi:hypothetical protein
MSYISPPSQTVIRVLRWYEKNGDALIGKGGRYLCEYITPQIRKFLNYLSRKKQK